MITIVIPTINELEYTKKCIESLKHTAGEYQLYFVDDGSTDGTREWIVEQGYSHTFNDVQRFTNWNWNEGIRRATTDVIVIANNDILFTKDWDLPLITALKDKVMVASPFFTQGELPKDFPLGGERHANSMRILGCCFAVRRELFDKIGLFPEQLKLWYGDNWLGEMTWRAGYETSHVKESYIHHFISRSANKDKVVDFNKIVEADQREYAAIQKGWA